MPMQLKKLIARVWRYSIYINQLRPDRIKVHQAFDRLFNEPMDETTHIATPCQIDFANQVKLGKHVFINHSLCMMSAGGVIIDDGVQIGPQTTIVTANHDFHDHNTLLCKPVHIKKRVARLPRNGDAGCNHR